MKNLCTRADASSSRLQIHMNQRHNFMWTNVLQKMTHVHGFHTIEEPNVASELLMGHYHILLCDMNNPTEFKAQSLRDN